MVQTTDHDTKRIQLPCKFIGTEERVYIRKNLNSHRIDLVHQHVLHFIVLEHQHDCNDVMSIRSNGWPGLTKQEYESKRTKTKTFVIVKALKRAVWNILTGGCFNFFLEFSFGDFYGANMSFTILSIWFLNSWEACSVRCRSVAAKTRLSWRTFGKASCCSLHVSNLSRGLSRTQNSFCNKRSSKWFILKHRSLCCWSADRWMNSMKR